MSKAISAQGCKLEIETGSGGAKTITGVALGYPTIITIAAHGFSNGGVVDLASIIGTTSLNGKQCVVKNATANTFAVEIDTTGGTTYTSGGTATPVALTQINGFKTFQGFDGSASEIDTTDLNSTAKEFILGLVDEGGFSFEMNRLDPPDPGQVALQVSRNAGTKKNYVFTLPNGETATFAAYSKTVPLTGGVDGAMTSAPALKISGPVTWA